MTTTAQLIAVLAGEVGYHEGRNADGHWNNHEKYAAQVPGMAWVSTDEEPWCDVFKCWAYQTAGMPAGSYPVTASVAVSRNWWKAHGRFSEYPSVGAQILFGVNGDVHTGIVVDYDDTYVYTIEGNTNTNGSSEGDGVYHKTHRRTDAYVYGYGHPAGFTGAVKAVEAKYRQTATPPTPKPPTKPKTKPYVVRLGQTLSAIAALLSISLPVILADNPGIKDPNSIVPGQTIQVPYDATPKPSPTSPKPTPTPTPKPPTKPKPPVHAKPKPVVDLSNLVAAALRDPALRQGGTTHAADVRLVEKALQAEGLLSKAYASDGSFGSASVSAYAAWQRRCGYRGAAADGIPGASSLARLAARHGFTVKG